MYHEFVTEPDFEHTPLNLYALANVSPAMLTFLYHILD